MKKDQPQICYRPKRVAQLAVHNTTPSPQLLLRWLLVLNHSMKSRQTWNLHEEVPHWLCQPASMSPKREKLHPLKNHTTSCTKCCVTEGGGETTLSQHYTKTYPVEALERHAQLHLNIMLSAVPCNQQALSRVVHNTMAYIQAYGCCAAHFHKTTCRSWSHLNTWNSYPCRCTYVCSDNP